MFFKVSYVPAMLLLFMAAPSAHAATTPSLGAAAPYAVLGSTYSNTTAGTTITGSVGFTTGPAVAPGGVHPEYGPGGSYSSAGTGQAGALSALASQPCTFTFPSGAIDLATDTTHGSIGVYTPGVYCTSGAGAASIGTAGITLSGGGTYIFRILGALTSVASSTVSLVGGASACDVFWTPTAATTLAANTTFTGTVIDNSGITVGATTTWDGRALAFGGTVTTDADTITVPAACSSFTPPPTSSPQTPPLINVRKVPSPLNLPAGPGPVTYSYTVTNPGDVPMTNVTLTDDKCGNVVRLSGDTDGNSQLDISETWMYSCTTTLTETTINYATARGIANDMAAVDTAIAEVVVGVPVVPPLIHIVKTPSPLTLPFNGGAVTYSYVVTNPGTVALTDVSVTDDKCGNVAFVSGNSNGDAMLQSNETWTYTCTTNIPQTTINTAIATGHANGLTAIDTALATVFVAGSPIPPLIHVIKSANPIILPATGGWVTYSYSVTNPGTVPLSNVTLTDDRCTTVTPVSGDANGNALMETNETWTYTCQKYIEYTTTNTATATGQGNGFTVTDFALASVVVAPALLPSVPAFPNTGFGPEKGLVAWIVASAGLFVGATLLLALSRRKRLF